MLEQVLTALKSIRAPVATDEYDLHQLACQALAQAGIGCVHEAQLAPRCRIDVLCGRVGIEIKRGRPTASALTRQLTRYAQSGALDALVVLSEQSVSLPEQIAGVPVRLVCLYKLWGLSDAGGGMEHPQDETLIKAGVAMRLAQDALALPRLESSDYQDADVPAYLQDAHLPGIITARFPIIIAAKAGRCAASPA